MSGIVGNGHDPSWNPIQTPTNFVGAYDAPDWLIDGIVQHGRLYACTSPTAHGKTSVWLHNIVMVQMGTPVGKLVVDKGNGLILAGENPQDLQGRMMGMKIALGLPYSAFPHVLPMTFPLDEANLEILHHHIKLLGMPLALIVVDTAASFSPVEEENDSKKQGDYARALRTLTQVDGNPAVVVLCHPTKNPDRTNLLPRGGGGFLNEVDANLTLWSDELGLQTTLHWQAKLRGPPFEPLVFKLKSVPTGKIDKRGRTDMTVIAQPMDEAEAANRIAQSLANEQAVLKTLYHNPGKSMGDIALIIGWPKEERWRVQDAYKVLGREKLVRNIMKKWEVTEAGAKYLRTNGLLAVA